MTGASSNCPMDENSTSAPILDPNTVAQLRQAQADYGNPQFIAQLIGIYKKNAPGRVDQIRDALERVEGAYTLLLTIGQTVVSGPAADIVVGNALPLKGIPVGTVVHNIEFKPGAGAKIARSAGAGAQLMAKEGGYALLRVPSGELRKVRVDCYATVGQVGNLEHENISIGKAGRNRWLGWKSHNRGVAMNPVDHPMGGGEGKTSGGRHPCSPWGWKTKGFKTRNNKRSDSLIVKRRKS